MMLTISILLIILIISHVESFSIRFSNPIVKQISAVSKTSLFAHHVEKKIIKRKMDRRPKKHRLSDINRKNVNHDKCITKVANAPADYTILSAADYDQIRNNALKFWENGDSATEWVEFIETDMVATFSQNRDPLPEGGVLKKPKLARSGSC